MIKNKTVLVDAIDGARVEGEGCVSVRKPRTMRIWARAQVHTVCTVSADVACVLSKAQIKRVRAG